VEVRREKGEEKLGRKKGEGRLMNKEG